MSPSVVAVIFVPGSRRVLARVSGEIDMDDAAGLREALATALAASRSGLDIDLAAVTFCDSSGLDVLLDLNRRAMDAGKTLVLTAVSRPTALLLSLTGAQRVLTVRDWPALDSHRADGRPGPARTGAGEDDGGRRPAFELHTWRYGATLHLAPTGELDMDTGPALDEVPAAALDGADVVACDMQHLTFLDVAGLSALLGFVRRLDARGIAVFTYNWQPEPRRLLHLIDGRYPPADGSRPIRMLHCLRGSPSAARATGAARTPQDIGRSAASSSSPDRPKGRHSGPGP
ncbi:STAS domain-containing protein [Streptomyces narbonensis]|uniref:STAS domain-containing protein n=1 Tax=Streptomyces narbonensis TaxID=67333 RepID=A0ABV3CCA4_9ACTN